METERQLTATDLLQFTGTMDYHKHWTGRVVFSDGVLYMAEHAGAFWLIDAIISHSRRESFQIWELHKNEDNTAALIMIEDIGLPELVRREIPYTDFPLDDIKLYLIKGVLLLPSEY